MSEAFYDAGIAMHHPLGIEPEGGGSLETLNHTIMGWGYWSYTTPAPSVDAWKVRAHTCRRSSAHEWLDGRVVAACGAVA